MGYESQNLTALHDVPALEDQGLMDYLITIKELIEEMLGRRGNQPLTPQMQLGTYIGNGVAGDRLIVTMFRPRWVRVMNRPVEGALVDRVFERLDDPDQSMDWGDYSMSHTDAASYHTLIDSYGITGILDTGFYVSGNDGTSHPNIAPLQYDWIVFG